jgi:outer membrane receptor protein involved in Fe transport
MSRSSLRSRLAASTILGSILVVAALGAQPAFAQATSDTAADNSVETVVVTGSRIHRDASDTTTAVPVDVVNSQELSDRGYVQAGQALNTLTSMTPSIPITPHNGGSSGSGQQFPDLFNLGPERTLTLVNGRRFVNSGTGLGDNTVDTNMIPVGLLDRVDVVMGGGSVVYGSGAIAGVVNYVLKDHFNGLEVDAQSGISEKGDYPQNSIRATAGTDIFDGRGNIAFDAEWSKSEPLLDDQRLNVPQVGYTAADSSPPGSKTSVVGLLNTTFWEFSQNGVLFVNPPGTLTPTGYQAAFGGAFLVTNTGQHYGAPGAIPQQFAADGSGLINYNVGTNPPNGATPLNIPFSSGGDGFKYTDLGSLLSGVERYSGNAIGYVNLTSKIKLSTELLYGHTQSTDPEAEFGNNSNTVLNNQPSGGGAIIINASNPYLPASARNTIVNYLNTALGPGLGFAWAAGAPIPAFGVGLSKAWTNLLPSYADTVNTDTERGLLALDGTFTFNGFDYYWDASGSVGHSESTDHHYDEIVSNFNNAVDAVTNGSGDIVCAINNPVVTDAACTPINPFTRLLPTSSLSAIRSYATGLYGQSQSDTEQDYLATLGGPLATLPAGDLQFSTSYEHRAESARFTPTLDTQLGLGPSGTPTSAASGSYDTNELAAEILAPIVGKNFTLPAVQSFDLSGAYRYVSNSVAGDESVWDVGARWTVVDGLTLRGSRSRNFRAPTLLQLFDPSTTALNAVGYDPCDSREIHSGPGGSVNRIANCSAEWAAHPGYAPLKSFQDLAQNFSTAAITTSGNPTLKNELSDVWTYGAVLQPNFIPGLSITADRIQIKIAHALTQVEPDDILEACYDSTGAAFAANPLCNGTGWTRDATGQIVAANSTFLNAASYVYKGETYNVAYGFDLDDLWHDDKDRGHLDLNLQSTYTEKNATSILGNATTELAGTAQTSTNAFGDPRWVTRFDIGYTLDRLRVSYELVYLPSTLVTHDATIASTPYPKVAANLNHSISAQYAFDDNWIVRAGISNFTDEKPSFPLINYGDIIGRRYFLGLNVKY